LQRAILFAANSFSLGLVIVGSISVVNLISELKSRDYIFYRP